MTAERDGQAMLEDFQKNFERVPMLKNIVRVTEAKNSLRLELGYTEDPNNFEYNFTPICTTSTKGELISDEVVKSIVHSVMYVRVCIDDDALKRKIAEFKENPSTVNSTFFGLVCPDKKKGPSQIVALRHFTYKQKDGYLRLTIDLDPESNFNWIGQLKKGSSGMIKAVSTKFDNS